MVRHFLLSRFNHLIHYYLVILIKIMKPFVEVSKCSCKCVNLSNPGKVIDFLLAFMKTFWIRNITTIKQITTKKSQIKPLTNINSQLQNSNKDYNHEHKHKQNLSQTQTHNCKTPIRITTTNTNTNSQSQSFNKDSHINNKY